MTQPFLNLITLFAVAISGPLLGRDVGPPDHRSASVLADGDLQTRMEDFLELHREMHERSDRDPRFHPDRRAQLIAAADAVFSGTDIDELQYEPIAAALDIPAFRHWCANTRSSLYDRLEALIATPDWRGAAAAARVMDYRIDQEDTALERLRLIERVVDHPGWKEALRRGQRHAGWVFDRFDWVFEAEDCTPEIRERATARMLHLCDVIDDSIAPESTAGLRGYFEDLLLYTAAARHQERESVRHRLVATVNALRTVAAYQCHAAQLTALYEFLTGPFARGEFIGSVAPELDFIWRSAECDFASLADLRGKVVVLNFWTTTCGYCFEALPDIAALQRIYEECPVEIIGVTSLQGEVLDGHQDPPFIDTSADPTLEFKAIERFIEHYDIEYPIVFSEQAAYNPAYGNRVPGMVILDPNGVVRFGSFSPMFRVDPLAVKRQRIDTILEEFGLRTPYGTGE